VGQQHAHRVGKVTNETWRQCIKGGKVAQALKDFQQQHAPEGGDRRFRRAFNERQVVRGWCVQLLQFFVAKIGTDTWIRRLMDGRHDLTPDMSRAKSILCARSFSEGYRCSKTLQSHAKTDARNNVQIVDKGDEFPHYSEDAFVWQ